MFVFLYAVVFPAGIGMCYWTPIMSVWEWFPDNKGLVTGLIVGGFGFGAFIFGFITTAIANPHNEQRIKIDGSEYFPKDVADQVPKMYQTTALIWVGLATVGILLVKRNPEYVAFEARRQKAEA